MKPNAHSLQCSNIFKNLKHLRATARWVVAAACLTTPSDRNTREAKVRAAVATTENVVVHTVIGDSTSDIDERDAGNVDAVGWVSSGTTVQVILLNIDTVVCDARQGDVLVDNVGNTAGGVGIGLDTATVLTVDDLGVLEGHGVDDVVTLTTNGSDAQTVATRAVEVVDDDVGSAGNGNAVILVVDVGVLQGDVCALGNVESVGVVTSSIAITGRVGVVAGSVVQHETGDGEVLDIFNLETVDGPVDDVQVGDLGVVDILDDDEVVRPV